MVRVHLDFWRLAEKLPWTGFKTNSQLVSSDVSVYLAMMRGERGALCMHCLRHLV